MHEREARDQTEEGETLKAHGRERDCLEDLVDFTVVMEGRRISCDRALTTSPRDELPAVPRLGN